MLERTAFIPDAELAYQMSLDEKLREAHERLANVSLDKFKSDIPLQNDPYDKSEASYVDLRHSDDPGDKHAVVLPLPFANGWAPHMALRAKLLQDSMDVPHRIVVFPNNVIGSKSYELSKPDLEAVSSGQFDPIAEKQLSTLQKLGIESVQYIGYSQGATIGAAALKLAALQDRFELGSSGLFEPPNMIARNKKQLQKAFMSGGLNSLNRAVNDSGIPALTEAQRSAGRINSFKQLGGMLIFAAGSQLPVNKAIHEGFTYDRFMRNIGQIPSNVVISLAGARDSAITPIEEIERLSKLDDLILRSKVVEGYGHEMGDNIVVHTLLAKTALSATALA